MRTESIESAVLAGYSQFVPTWGMELQSTAVLFSFRPEGATLVLLLTLRD